MQLVTFKYIKKTFAFTTMLSYTSERILKKFKIATFSLKNAVLLNYTTATYQPGTLFLGTNY